MPNDNPPNSPSTDLQRMVSNIIAGVREASGTFLSDGSTLRQRMLDDGYIIPVRAEFPPPATMCAVDGGRITKQLYSGDLLVAYAVSAEAESAQHPGQAITEQWAAALAHSKDTDKVCGIAMMCLEQAILQQVEHEVRIIDGSFYSPIIEINKTLSIAAKDARTIAAKTVQDYALTQNLTRLLTGSHPTRFLALPKSDSSRDYAETLAARYDVEISVNDKVLAAHLLRPGEMLKPRVLSLWRNRGLVTEPTDWRIGKDIAQETNTAITAAAQAAEEERLVVTYLKGHNPLAVIKAEYFRNTAEDTGMDDWVAATLINEARLTHAQEPAAQYKADIQAKGVSVIERQLREIVVSELHTSGEEALAALFSTQYRT